MPQSCSPMSVPDASIISRRPARIWSPRPSGAVGSSISMRSYWWATAAQDSRGEPLANVAYGGMARRRADGEPGLIDRVRWRNVGRLAVLLAAGLLIALGPRGCGENPASLPPETRIAPPAQPPATDPAARDPQPAEPRRHRPRQRKKRRHAHKRALLTRHPQGPAPQPRPSPAPPVSPAPPPIPSAPSTAAPPPATPSPPTQVPAPAQPRSGRAPEFL